MAGAKKPGGVSAVAKIQLKAIADALKQEKFDDAVERARDVLENDSKNYQALIFLGFALDKTEKLDDAVKVYEEAAAVKPGDANVWQGLIKVFEKQGAKSIPKYKDAALQLALIYRDADDLFKCQGVVDKFTGFARSKGDTKQIVDALSIILPESPIYTTLQGRVPRPAATYATLAKLVEEDEQKRISTLIAERRTRIGARLVDVTVQVKAEVFADSQLTHLYDELINWTNDDDLRRDYEEKLLAYRVERLSAFSGEEKSQELEKVKEFARGMVVIDYPYQLAWDIAVDWEDRAEISDYDIDLLWKYRTHFPGSGLGKVLSGFLTSDISPFAQKAPEEETKKKREKGDDEVSEDEDEASEEEDGGEAGDEKKDEAKKPRRKVVPLPDSDEERLASILDGIKTAKSFLAYRMLGLWYQDSEDYPESIDLMRKALKSLESRRSETGIRFQHTEDALTAYLATALIYHQTPHNHPEAKKLFQQILEHNDKNTPALIGIGLISEEELNYDSAASFLGRALERNENDLRVRSEAAWVHTLRGNYAHAKTEFEECIPLLTQQVQSKVLRVSQPAKKLLALTQYRLGVCLWDLDPSKPARKDRNNAYRHYLNALKNDLTLAPAYTSLGVFYADYGKDKKRAFKCFMKAIELSDGELESGRRLVQTFADKHDWDSIELVAQRVIDSGQATPPWGSKKPAYSWPFAALGTAQLHKKEYNKAMMSFRMATRISGGSDYHSFVALAETYLRARMHYSAIRAIDQARRIEEEGGLEESYDKWFTDYLLANVHRGVGEFDKAIELYQSILEERPHEQGVLIALMHAMAESADACIKTGLFGEAASKAADTLAFASNVPAATAESTFGFWVAVASACTVFTTVQGQVNTFPASVMASLVSIGSDTDAAKGEGEGDHAAYQYLQDIDRVGTNIVLAESIAYNEKSGVNLMRCLHATILAFKRELHIATTASKVDPHMLAIAHYNLGWAEYRAHTCLPEDLRNTLNGFLRAAIRCFKRAIEFETGNRKFWNALGVATSSVHAPVAQHAFTRSLFLGRGRASVWANLGTLALIHDDPELANHAFTAGQSSDPDYALSWVGQGYVALQFGEAAEARSLFLHAMDLSDASSLAAREQYAISLFDHLVDVAEEDRTEEEGSGHSSLARPLIGLEQVRRLRPEELPYAHLLALYGERVQDRDTTVTILEKICTILEADFEATQSVESLKRVAVAKADLARAYVALGEYDQALECSDMALQLVADAGDDEDIGELSAPARRKVELSAHLAGALAKFFTEDFDGALAEFEAIWAMQDRTEEGRSPDAVCLFAQVLWATGTEEARQRAQDELFSVIEAHPDHIQAILLLGVVALLTGDADSAEAVVSELVDLQEGKQESSSGAKKSVTVADHARIGQVLHALANPEGLNDGDSIRAARTQAQRDIMLHPYLPHSWAALGDDVANEYDESVEEEEEYCNDMSLKLTTSLLPPRGELGPEDLARACVRTRYPADAQVAIMAAPWLADGWQGLADAIA
ncbi:antiviral protein [Ophiostoma piceae UAMH 11346]|uniref:Antiviral protein n=1 Tax=Ophiostoma piceae (strain UAMH 11346) TaxID=1262450 RepID=S3CSK0_OPHP1|nr:antiviral protein [Ophiostoma piceae UAMH 11346]